MGEVIITMGGRGERERREGWWTTMSGGGGREGAGGTPHNPSIRQANVSQ